MADYSSFRDENFDVNFQNEHKENDKRTQHFCLDTWKFPMEIKTYDSYTRETYQMIARKQFGIFPVDKKKNILIATIILENPCQVFLRSYPLTYYQHLDIIQIRIHIFFFVDTPLASISTRANANPQKKSCFTFFVLFWGRSCMRIHICYTLGNRRKSRQVYWKHMVTRQIEDFFFFFFNFIVIKYIMVHDVKQILLRLIDLNSLSFLPFQIIIIQFIEN